jgi:hypothetical protein
VTGHAAIGEDRQNRVEVAPGSAVSTGSASGRVAALAPVSPVAACPTAAVAAAMTRPASTNAAGSAAGAAMSARRTASPAGPTGTGPTSAARSSAAGAATTRLASVGSRSTGARLTAANSGSAGARLTAAYARAPFACSAMAGLASSAGAAGSFRASPVPSRARLATVGGARAAQQHQRKDEHEHNEWGDKGKPGPRSKRHAGL